MTHEDKKGSEKEVVELKSINDLNLADISILDGSKFEIMRKVKPSKDEKTSVCSIDSNCIVRKISGGRGISLKVRNGHNKNALTDIGRFPDGLLKNDLVARLSNRISSQSKRGTDIARAKTDYKEAWESSQSATSAMPEAAIERAQKHLIDTAEKLYALSEKEFVHSKITTEKNLLALDLQCQKISFIDNVDDDGEGCSILLNGSLIGKMKITSIFRSPQSVIYYLGKYSRTSDKLVYKIHNHGDETEVARCGTFVIRVNEGVSRQSIISTKHRGKYYSINKSNKVNGCSSVDQRSSQAIALVQQLVNLHKSAENLPSTTAIQITP